MGHVETIFVHRVDDSPFAYEYPQVSKSVVLYHNVKIVIFQDFACRVIDEHIPCWKGNKKLFKF